MRYVQKSHVYISREDWCETRMGVFYNLIMWYIISKFRVAWKFHSISWRTYSSCLCLCIAPALQILVCNCISISTRFARFTFLSSTTKFSTSLNEHFPPLFHESWRKEWAIRRSQSRGELSFSIFSFHSFFLFWFGIWEGI